MRPTRETVYAVTSLDTLQASPSDLSGYVCGHLEDVVFAEDAPTVHTGSAPRGMAALRNWPSAGYACWERTTWPRPPEQSGTPPNTPPLIWGITDSPLLPGT